MKNNKTAVLTGASSGIGRALSFELAQEYRVLFICGRDVAKLQRLKNDLENDFVSVFVVEIDLLDCSSIEKGANQINENCIKVDLLVNNAGVSQRSFASDTDGEVEKMLFQVNYFAPVQLTKLLLDKIKNSSDRKIVIVSSIVGKFGYYLRSSYSASKHALHGYFESLRMEEEHCGVKVLLVVVGRAQTNISKNAITKNGVKYNKIDRGQKSGLTAELVAKKIGSGIRKGSKEILIGGKEIWMVHLRKFFPWLFYKLAKHKIKKEGGV